MTDEVTSPIRQAIERVLETPAQKVARAIADIGNSDKPRTLYQPPKLSEHDAELQHRQEMAQRLK